jgi:glycogen phosphorylase
VKRLHEHKHQHLNVLKLVTVYNRLRRSSGAAATPGTVIFGGKEGLQYRMAKLIIKLINCIARAINQDPLASQVLKVEFLPDFNVKNGYRICPAADLSEQTSTAGKKRRAQAT